MIEDNIFVSHSKKDKEMVNSFDHIFARTTVEAVCMEFEKMGLPEWKDIRKKIVNSLATFVFLSKNITESVYTQNWIAFEIGISCSFDKEVWVFKRNDAEIKFPIPYVTNYLIYKDIENPYVFNYIRQIIEGYQDKDRTFKDVNSPDIDIPKGKKLDCPNCQKGFNYHSPEFFDVINCPLCLGLIKIPKLTAKEKLNKYFK